MRRKITKQALLSKEKINHVVKVSLQLFRENGFDETTLKEISEVSGISVGSIYHFFGSKIGIIRCLCSAAFDGYLEYLAVTDKNLKSPKSAIVSMYLSIAHYYDNVLGVSIVKHAYKLRNEDAHLPVNERLYANFDQAMTRFIQASDLCEKSPYPIKEDELACYMKALFNGCVVNWAWNAQNSVTSLEDAVRECFFLALEPFG